MMSYSQLYDKTMRWWSDVDISVKERVLVRAFMIEHNLTNSDVDWSKR